MTKYPWLVLLTMHQKSTLCTGTLVDNDWVHTAAHCIYSGSATGGDQLVAYAFANVSSTNDLEDPLTLESPIASVHIHPGYAPDAFWVYEDGRWWQEWVHDVAMLPYFRFTND